MISKHWHSRNPLGYLIIAIISFSGISCASMSPQEEPISEHYWEAQSLHIDAKNPAGATRALTDLGILLLRSGQLEEASNILSRAMVLDVSDTRLWFYAGLLQELRGLPDEAVANYNRAPTTVSESVFSKAIKGRVNWIEENNYTEELSQFLQDYSPEEQDLTLSPDALAVIPMHCSSNQGAGEAVGLGLSYVLNNNFSQIAGVTTPDAMHVARMYYELNPTMASIDIEAIRKIAHFFEVSFLVHGKCALDSALDISAEIYDINQDTVYSLVLTGDVQDFSLIEGQFMDQASEVMNIWVPDRERRMPTANFNAQSLIAFGNALQSELQGDLNQSRRYGERTLAYQPNFNVAAQRKVIVDNKILASSDEAQGMLDLIVRLENRQATNTLLELSRMQAQAGIGSAISRDRNSRKLPPGSIGELPTPPTPTGN